MVFAAASTIDVMSEVLDEFEKETGHSARVNFASTSSLAQLMIQGARADLFMSASSMWADKVQSEIDGIQRIDMLSNRMVLVAPRDSDRQVRSLKDLADPAFQRIAMADPQAVPAGIYAKMYLDEAGLWLDGQGPLTSRIAVALDVRHALALVEQSAADVGFVYATDAACSDAVRIMLHLPDRDPPVVYPLLWNPGNTDSPVADQLVKFMMSDRAKRIFVRHGFRMLKQ